MQPHLPSLAIIGAGRVGTTLGLAAHRAGYTVKAVHTRTLARARPLLEVTGAWLAPDLAAAISSADLILLAVPDDAISRVDEDGAAAWRPGSGVVHHSGLHPAAVLHQAAAAGAFTGAMHPLQAISDPVRALDLLQGAYFGLSGDARLLPTLETLVYALGGRPLLVPDDAKPLYHAAAVFASNYLVTCFAEAVDILAGLGIDRQDAAAALLPLARGAVANLTQPGLPYALTGPITRGDTGTLQAHQVQFAAKRPDLLPLYRLLGLATIPIAAAQGRLTQDQIDELERVLSPRT